MAIQDGGGDANQINGKQGHGVTNKENDTKDWQDWAIGQLCVTGVTYRQTWLIREVCWKKKGILLKTKLNKSP